jgi:RNA polymerase sigma-70 factor (ECF subfamily)
MEAVTIGRLVQISCTNAEQDDLSLVNASRNGDAAAFSELVKRYDRKVLRIALKVTQNIGDAEEAVQEAFFKAYQRLGQFREHAKFSTWLVRIVLNESFMKLRKSQAGARFVDYEGESDSGALPLDVTDWRPSPETLYCSSEFREILIRSLQKLTPALKAVFVLRDIEEYSLAETAEILNLTSTSTRTRLSRARLKIREELSKYFKKPE